MEAVSTNSDWAKASQPLRIFISKARDIVSTARLTTLIRFSARTVRAVAALLLTALAKGLIYAWRHPIHVFTSFALALLLVVALMTGATIQQRIVDETIVGETVTDLISASNLTRRFESSDLASQGVRELTGAGAPEWVQREAIKAVLREARERDLSLAHQAILLATVEIESGFNPFARAASTSACGLFQFVKATGERYGLSAERCMDPHDNAKAGIAHYLDNFEKKVEKQVDGLNGAEKLLRTFELSYYMHHDGPGAAAPANDVRAIVLSGSPFLLRAYDVLVAEEHKREKAAKFSDEFSANIVQLVRRGLEVISETSSHYSTAALAVTAGANEAQAEAKK